MNNPFLSRSQTKRTRGRWADKAARKPDLPTNRADIYREAGLLPDYPQEGYSPSTESPYARSAYEPSTYSPSTYSEPSFSAPSYGPSTYHTPPASSYSPQGYAPWYSDDEDEVTPYHPTTTAWSTDDPASEHGALSDAEPGVKMLDMWLALLISASSHIGLPLLIALVAVIIALLMGLDLSKLFAPKPPPDIEFVLTDQQERPPINKNTPFVGEHESQAGGKHDPTQPIKPPEPIVRESAPSTPTVASQAAPQVQKPAPKPVEKQIQPKPQPPKETVKPPPKMETKPTPKAIVVRPKLESSKPSKPVDFSDALKVARGSSSMPIRSTPSLPSSSSMPSVASAGHSGAVGNPGPGNPNGAPGVDVRKLPDFGPYMAELSRAIKAAWSPPRGNNSHKVIVVFKVYQDGKIDHVKVTRSSGLPQLDSAAVAAVYRVSPFKPLPSAFRQESVDIEYTFDYNVFGDKQKSSLR